MTPESFSKAIQFGAKYAREALAEPKEGTILTVLTDFSNHLILLVQEQTHDFEHLLEMGIKEAEKSLENTPNLLSVLKKAGVVDAGAQGFVDLLHGIFSFIKDGDLRGFKTDLKKQEIQKLIAKTQQKGLTLVPLKLYFKRGYAKVEVGLGRGKSRVAAEEKGTD